MWLSLAMSYIPISIPLVLRNTVDINAIMNPKLLYYTPGLWQKTGMNFWKAFLFETPFAINRGFLVNFPLFNYFICNFRSKSSKILPKNNS